jgi:Holliday junction resolvase-like predicted endonuclease
MDVGERIVSEYLKMNGFTFVTNVKYENNRELDILAKRESLNCHIEIQSTLGSWKFFDYSYIQENLVPKFPSHTDYLDTVYKYFNKNEKFKKIWIHWAIKPEILNNQLEYENLITKAKTEADVDEIIELKNILRWMIDSIKSDSFYFDRSNDQSYRYIELFLELYPNEITELADHERIKLNESLGCLQPKLKKSN